MPEFEKLSTNQLDKTAERPRFPAENPDSEQLRRILVGVRLEHRLVKVMKALAELNDCTLGQLVEDVFMHAMEGGSAFAKQNKKLSPEKLQQIQSLKQVYGVNYTATDLHAKKSAKKRAKR